MSWASIDNSVTDFVNGLSGNPAVDSAAIAVTTYGAIVIVALVAIRWWWHRREDRARERYLAILCGASVALGLGINQFVLLFVHRVRPYDAGITHRLALPSPDPSFPSDHATLGFAVALALLGAGARRGWIFLAAAALLSATRLYIGTHYFSDVLGGAITGGLAAAICLAVLRSDSRIVRLGSRIL